MGAAERTKGHNFERKIARELRETGLCPDAKRGFQTRGGTAEDPDVKGCGRLLIECKAHKQVNRRKAWLQAAGPAKAGEVPVAVCKDDFHEPVVVMDARDLPMIGAGFYDGIDQPLLIEIGWEDWKRYILPKLLHTEEA
jgi:hypothetical protein